MRKQFALILVLWLRVAASAQTPLSSIMVESGPVSVQSDGAFSFGAETGVVTGGTAGRFVFTLGGALTIPFDAAAGGGVLVGRQAIDDEPYDESALLMLLKRPASLITADLAGDWNLLELELRTNANQTRLEAQRSSFVLSVDAGGTFQLPEGSGTMSPDGSGRVQVVAGTDTLIFDISAAKDVMVGAETVSDGTTYLRVLTRQPIVVSAGGVTGLWRYNELSLLSVTNRDYTRINVNGEGVDLAADQSFSIDGQNVGTWGVTNSPPGVFLFESAESFTGVLAINVAGDVAIDVTSSTDTKETALGVAVRSPANATVADLAGEWRLTRLAIRHVQDSTQIWFTNHFQGGAIQERYEGRYVDGRLVKEGSFEEFDDTGRHLRLAIYTNDMVLARTDFGYHATGGTNFVGISQFRTDGSLIEEVNRSYFTNGILERYSRDQYSANGQLADQIAIGFFADGNTNTVSAGAFRTDGTRIHLLEDTLLTNGVLAFHVFTEYGPDGGPLSVTNVARRVDGTLLTKAFEDHTVPGVRSERREYHPDGTTLKSISRHLAGELDGRQETFYANGLIAGVPAVTSSPGLSYCPRSNPGGPAEVVLHHHGHGDGLHHPVGLRAGAAHLFAQIAVARD
jgi:hypothetical protein